MCYLRHVLTGLVALAFFVVFSSVVGYADTITYFDNVGGVLPWSATLSFPKYDSSVCPGCLQSVHFTLLGFVDTQLKLENTEDYPFDVDVGLGAIIVLYRPDFNILVDVYPQAYKSEQIPAFDGRIDYTGPSGRVWHVIDDATQTMCTTCPDDLALFSGTGEIALPVTAAENFFM